MGYLTAAKPAVQARDVRTDIKGESLVENRMTGLLNKDSAYMKQAETRGEQQAQSRGLLSSSLAVGAIENERINAALPIAQQDASLYGQRDLQDGAYRQQGALNEQGYTHASQQADQAFGQQQSLNEQQHGYAKDLSAQGYDQNRGLQEQQYGFNSRLSGQEFDQNKKIQEQNFGYEQSLAKDQFGYQQDLNDQTYGQQQQMQQNDFGYQTSLNEQQNAAQAQLAMDNQLANIRLDTSQQIAAIESDPNSSAEQKNAKVQNLLTLQNVQVAAIQSGNRLASTNFTYPPTADIAPPTQEQMRQEFEATKPVRQRGESAIRYSARLAKHAMAIQNQ